MSVPFASTRELERVMSGSLPLEQASKAVQSWARKPIYDEAARLLAIEDKNKRQDELAALPENIREYVRNEALRIWRIRIDAIKTG